MAAIIAGATGGLLMSSIFVCVGVLSLFSVVKDPPPGYQAIFERFPPGTAVLAMTFLAYPVWGIIGAVLGLLYKICSTQAAGPGLGSPNLVFTAAVVVAGVLLVAPLAVLLRRLLSGVLTIALAFVGVFGWFVPYFAT